MIAEKCPAIGMPVLNTGSFAYRAVWPTFLGFQMHTLELLGHGAAAADYMGDLPPAPGQNEAAEPLP